MRRIRTGILAALVTGALALGWGAPAQARAGSLDARPDRISFGKKAVGGTYLKSVKIANTTGSDLSVYVQAGLPDDFGFGFYPGADCPMLGAGILPAKTSCTAVVQFRPTEFFIGWAAEGSVVASVIDPATGATVEQLVIPVTGMAVAAH